MLNGYQENLLSCEIAHDFPPMIADISALTHQSATYELLRRKSDFLQNPLQKPNLLNDLNLSYLKEFKDPLNEIEKRFLLTPNSSERTEHDKDFFDNYKENNTMKTYSLENKEDIKQKYIYNFVTNDIGKPNCFQVIYFNKFTFNPLILIDPLNSHQFQSININLPSIATIFSIFLLFMNFF